MAEVRTVAVIGAGAMGRNIAQFVALGGYRTILQDVVPASLRKAEAEFRNHPARTIQPGNLERSEFLPGEIVNGNLDAGVPILAAQRPGPAYLEYASRIEEAAREADLVIEAVPEELECKIEIFTLLDKICKPGTMLAATASSLSITEIASVTYRPCKCVALRFSGLPGSIPIDKTRKPEAAKPDGGRSLETQNLIRETTTLALVRGRATDDETMSACAAMGRRLGIDVVVESDSHFAMIHAALLEY